MENAFSFSFALLPTKKYFSRSIPEVCTLLNQNILKQNKMRKVYSSHNNSHLVSIICNLLIKYPKLGLHVILPKCTNFHLICYYISPSYCWRILQKAYILLNISLHYKKMDFWIFCCEKLLYFNSRAFQSYLASI